MNIHSDRGDALRSPFAAEGMRPDLSLKEYEKALERATWLSNADPREFSSRVGVLLERALIADAWREMDAPRSLPLIEALVVDADALWHEDPSNSQMEWLDALLRVGHADATRRAGHLREALPLYDVAVARIEKMRRSDRGRSISRRDVAKREGEAADAVRHYDEALVRWRDFGRRQLESAYLPEHRQSAEQRRDAREWQPRCHNNDR